MRRPKLQRQQGGFGLLAFVIITAVFAFSFVVGYSGVLTRDQANQLETQQNRYLADARDSILAFYERHAFKLDQKSLSNPASVEEVLKGANVRARFAMTATMSQVLLASDGTAYRAFALWMPTETDTTNGPNLTEFAQTGKFASCATEGGPCDRRVYMTFDTLSLERDLANQTAGQLQRIALKAQSYFRARNLQDPERNVSVNYFRTPSGACAVQPIDLECLDTYSPLATVDLAGKVTLSRTAINLGLAAEDVISAWGLPIEASNLQDSVTDDSPYTMVFRAATPSGAYYTVKAVQQL